MDLKAYLKCTLSLVLCIGLCRSVNFMECEMGLVFQKPGVSIQCYPSTELPHPIEETCQLLSCKRKDTIEWNMIDRKQGKLQVRFYGLPKRCNFEAYVVELEVYNEDAPYEEDLMCNTDNKSWSTHSRRTLENTHCSNCTVDLPHECLQEHIAHFSFVYPSYYRLKITPYINGSTRKAQRSYRFHINDTVTDYVKKQFVDIHLNASLQYRSTTRELDLGIPLLIEDPPDGMKIEVKFSREYIDLFAIVIHGNENSTSIRCEEFEKSHWPSCHVHKTGLACKFYNLTQEFYSVYISFTDDRCMRGTIWAGNRSDPCFWVIKKEFTDEKSVSNALTPDSDTASTQILYTISIIVILVGVIIISFVVKKINRKRKEGINGIIGKTNDNIRKPITEQTYNFSNVHANRFNFGQLLTLTERPKPEVLLVYARDTPPFMELVACFRRVLSKIFRCQVYDYFDPDVWSEVSRDPKGWIHALIVERQAKIILIVNEVSAVEYQSLMGEIPTRMYKKPHPFDNLFLYAVRLIRDGAHEESYKNMFVITFDGITENNHLIEYFNPYTRFVLPKHMYKLFEHLHDPDITINFDISRLEERHEVRQLRLQIDRIINLKLLGSSDLDSSTVYA